MALPQDGQNANGLTKVTEVPTGKELIFVDPTTNEGGIITLEDLTTQILNKLTSKIFTLDQGNITLIEALNKLNSKPVPLYCAKGRCGDNNKISFKFYPDTSIEEIFFFGRAGYNSALITQGIINYSDANSVSCKCFGDEQISSDYDKSTHVLTLTMAGTYASITTISKSKIENV